MRCTRAHVVSKRKITPQDSRTSGVWDARLEYVYLLRVSRFDVGRRVFHSNRDSEVCRRCLVASSLFSSFGQNIRMVSLFAQCVSAYVHTRRRHRAAVQSKVSRGIRFFLHQVVYTDYCSLFRSAVFAAMVSSAYARPVQTESRSPARTCPFTAPDRQQRLRVHAYNLRCLCLYEEGRRGTNSRVGSLLTSAHTRPPVLCNLPFIFATFLPPCTLC